jgi:hypothetical protein
VITRCDIPVQQAPSFHLNGTVGGAEIEAMLWMKPELTPLPRQNPSTSYIPLRDLSLLEIPMEVEKQTHVNVQSIANDVPGLDFLRISLRLHTFVSCPWRLPITPIVSLALFLA